MKKKKKKKWDSYFWGVGLLLFYSDLIFIKRESRTPTFNILVRTLGVPIVKVNMVGIASFLHGSV